MYSSRKLIFIFFIFIISGCDLLFDSYNDAVEDVFETIVDCAFSGGDEGPVEISTLTLVDGKLGINYSQTITSEIRFERDDNKYLYEYTYTPNQLPPGLSFRDSGRYLIVEGVPQAPGMYPVLIEVYSSTLDAKNAGRPDSCSKSPRASKSYILIIN